MAKVIARLVRGAVEGEADFRERCGRFVLSFADGLARSGEMVARMTLLEGRGLRPDMAWGQAHAHQPLPADTCIVASYEPGHASLDIHPYDVAQMDAAPMNPEVPPLMPHRMSISQFSAVAHAQSLGSGHGRKWEVFVGPHSLGFSDGRSQADAVVDVHRRCVSNALYVCTPGINVPEALAFGSVLPTVEAVGSHLKFLTRLPADGQFWMVAISLVNTQSGWGDEFSAAAQAEGWDLWSGDGGVQLRALADSSSPEASLQRAWSGGAPHQVVARSQLLSASPFEYAGMHLRMQLAAESSEVPSPASERLRA